MSNIPALIDEFEEMSEAGYKDWSTFRYRTELPIPLCPAEGTLRVVNTENFYTSCLLLESLRSLGLYCTGAVRQASQLFPKYTMIEPKHDTDRGQRKQCVCVEKHILAASWVDGAVLIIVSNADSYDTSTVFRRIGQAKVAFQAPTCIKNYNAAMQGVDRHDQLRGRIPIANRHSFKKRHKSWSWRWLTSQDVMHKCIMSCVAEEIPGAK
ncbi:unnamed protein product [Phytophthora fragariaefolia]|uniref:Unnamed protein product n=1 Tax=Phytophthora fragariaefolia TaxID=1490495 RepID=A0A9W6YG47_9STRA|nr:unnamed protein product [Phytophthora fragariaefolia]